MGVSKTASNPFDGEMCWVGKQENAGKFRPFIKYNRQIFLCLFYYNQIR